MIFRSVTSRLVFFYCLLLVVLGGAFLAFTVLSFQHYTRETLTSILSIRAKEVWNISGGLLDQPIRLHETIERRFSPESQDRFIRIHAGNTVLYQSASPTSGEFSAAGVPMLAPVAEGKVSEAHVLGNLLVLSRSFRDPDGNLVTVDAGQSDLFARTLQQRLATSLFVGLPLLLLLAAVAGVCPDAPRADAGGSDDQCGGNLHLQRSAQTPANLAYRASDRGAGSGVEPHAGPAGQCLFPCRAASPPTLPMNCARRSPLFAGNWNWSRLVKDCHPMSTTPSATRWRR